MKRIVFKIIGNNFTHEFVLFEVCAVAQVIFKFTKTSFFRTLFTIKVPILTYN